MKFPFPIKKEWGQNFLLDKNLLQKIVDNCPIDERTIIVEVGSGYGHLTEILAKTNCYQVISCEKDIRLFLWLKNKWKDKQNKVLFLHQNVLEIDWKFFCQKYNQPGDLNFLVVGNLPYGIANSLICSLLENFELFKGFVFLVQKEVAQRWTATPQKCKKEYSALSVYINLIAKSKLALKVPKQCFLPTPLVDGSLVCLEIKKPFLVEKERLTNLLNFLKNCFRHRRKTLWNNLLVSFEESKIVKDFKQLGFTKQTRPQELTAQEYLNLYRNLVG